MSDKKVRAVHNALWFEPIFNLYISFAYSACRNRADLTVRKVKALPDLMKLTEIDLLKALVMDANNLSCNSSLFPLKNTHLPGAPLLIEMHAGVTINNYLCTLPDEVMSQ